jgi:hypothetical protein
MEVSIGDIILAVAALWAAYKAGQLSIILPVTRMIKKEIEDGTLDPSFLEDAAEPAEAAEELLRFERVSGQYYAYSANSGQFLAQGANFMTLFESIKARFPGQNFRVNKVQAELSDEEVGTMVQSIFKVFGDKDDINSKTGQ